MGGMIWLLRYCRKKTNDWNMIDLSGCCPLSTFWGKAKLPKAGSKRKVARRPSSRFPLQWGTSLVKVQHLVTMVPKETWEMSEMTVVQATMQMLQGVPSDVAKFAEDGTVGCVIQLKLTMLASKANMQRH
eukprot:3367395-Amphidinium_carterae.1